MLLKADTPRPKLGSGLTQDFVFIREGFFLMGSEDGPDNEKPLHRVWVDAFMIGRFPVTNREYGAFVERTGYPEPPFWSQGMFSHPDKPVVGINWFDALAYCKCLTEIMGKPCRLPTEAEWEKSARGGKEEKKYPWGNDLPAERPYAGYDQVTGGPERIGLGEPNGFGLFDLSEGVHEWCSDFYDPEYYCRSPNENPQGPVLGRKRASRGGSWRHHVKFSRSAARSSLIPSFHYNDYGLRVVMGV